MATFATIHKMLNLFINHNNRLMTKAEAIESTKLHPATVNGFIKEFAPYIIHNDAMHSFRLDLSNPGIRLAFNESDLIDKLLLSHHLKQQSDIVGRLIEGHIGNTSTSSTNNTSTNTNTSTSIGISTSPVAKAKAAAKKRAERKEAAERETEENLLAKLAKTTKERDSYLTGLCAALALYAEMALDTEREVSVVEVLDHMVGKLYEEEGNIELASKLGERFREELKATYDAVNDTLWTYRKLQHEGNEKANDS